ncbi:hypothetical protein JXM67_04610 [candidate division WOR-3 bacterium]|nr:hypothetical protein [candidate division WOR-3 bacterium]
MDKQWLKRIVSVPLLFILSIIPIPLQADDREDHAQELVKIAEQRLAEGKDEAALRIANIVLSEFPDTRAANKAKEIVGAVGNSSSGTAPRTKSTTINPGSPDPAKACLWGLIPGGGQFHMGSYHNKAGNKKRACWNYCNGVGTVIGVPAYTVLAAVGIAESGDPSIEDNCLYQGYTCLFGDQCLQNYQNACLVVGVVSLIAVPTLWGGGAFTAWSDAKRVQAGDTTDAIFPRRNLWKK